eukprot:1561071-Rhodomonas_salina.1
MQSPVLTSRVQRAQALPYLYIGGLESAQDPQVHSDLKIRHVISILAVCPALPAQKRKKKVSDVAEPDESRTRALNPIVCERKL